MTNPTSDQLNDPEGQRLVQAIHDRKAQRDELRGTLANTICNASLYAKRAQPHLLGSDMSEVLDRTATAILAAGYRKPRTITTVEELDALPIGSVILDPIGLSLHKNPFTGWRASNGAKEIPADMLEREALPAVVLHEPEDGK